MTPLRSAVLHMRTAIVFLALTLAAVPFAAAQQGSALMFADRSVMNVDATGLDLRIENVPPREYPHVGYRSDVRFDDAAKEWAKSHFMLTGGSVNTLRITIRKGDIVEKLLPVKKGIAGWFRKDQSADYEAALDIEMAVVDPNGQVLSSATGKAFNSRSVPEGTTEEDKQQVWTGLIVATFDGLDNELLPQVRKSMSAYVRYQP